MSNILQNLAALVRPRTAPVPEQRTQLEQLQAAHNDAKAAAQRAQEAFDAEGTPMTQKALVKAKEAAQEALDYLERARRNLGAAEATEAEVDRKAKLARADELRAQLAAEQQRADELLAEEVKAWLAVVRAQLARRAHQAERIHLQRQIHAIECDVLGGDKVGLFRPEDSIPPRYPVAEAVRAEIKNHPDGAPIRELLSEFVERILAKH